MKPLLIVATLLSGDGPTGVETHFNQVLLTGRALGWDALLINPYTGSRLARSVYRPLKNLNSETARVLYRNAQAFSITREIRKVLARHPGRPTTIYAQCPLMAKAALTARRGTAAEVAAIIHYNVSEADEFITKGLGRPDGHLAAHVDQVERQALPAVNRVVFGSNFMRKIVNERVPALHAVPQETIFNFPPPPGGEPPENAGGERTHAGTYSRDLIAIGTLEPRKNQAFLLRVLAEARALGHPYTLTLVGDGPDRKSLEALSVSLGIANQVYFAGFQRRASALIPEHRAVLHASKAENCPLIVAETLSYGRPIFAAPVGGIPEMFSDGVEGRYWNLEDPRGAAQSLVALLENPPAYARAAAAARTHYERAFSHLTARWTRFLFPQFADEIPAVGDASPN